MTTATNKLRELENKLRIVGTLKEVNLQEKPTKKGDNAIFGNIIVETLIDGKLSNHRVELFAKETGKLFKGYKTILTQFKDSDTVGKENADRVSVTGNIDGNDYVNQEGKLISGNRNRGLFINRVTDQDLRDEAVAQIELVVTNTREVMKNDEPTGELYIDGFTVGYNDGVIELRNMIVGQDLADVISDNYEPNSTGKLTFEINNYVVMEEKPKDEAADTGFGQQVEMDTFERRVRELRVIGGFPPHVDERAYELEDIQLAKKIRALHLQEVQSTPATPPVTQSGGFGAPGFAAPNGSAPIDISDDDLPF